MVFMTRIVCNYFPIFLSSYLKDKKIFMGEMAEWFMALVLKTMFFITTIIKTTWL
jgi:hypothetical protein